VQRAKAIKCAKIPPAEPGDETAYRLSLRLDAGRNRDVDLSPEQLSVLVHEMEQVLALMDSLDFA